MEHKFEVTFNGSELKTIYEALHTVGIYQEGQTAWLSRCKAVEDYLERFLGDLNKAEQSRIENLS
jgi:hypothetical protein